MKKKIFISIIFSIIMQAAYTQKLDTAVHRHNAEVDAKALFQRSRNQHTAAWVLLGAGTGLAITGITIISADASQELSSAFVYILTLGTVTPAAPKHRASGPALAIAGTAAILGSIPLFIASGKNRNNARLLLKNEPVFFSPDVNVDHILALGVKIKL